MSEAARRAAEKVFSDILPAVDFGVGEQRRMVREATGIIDAEIERLKDNYQTMLDANMETLADNASLRQQVAELQQQVARLTADAELWRHAASAHEPCPPGIMPLAEAQQKRVCRICGEPPSTPLLLNYGREFACQSCVDAAVDAARATRLERGN